jgi:hypothetical protein
MTFKNTMCLFMDKGRRCLLKLQRTVQVGSSAGSLINNGAIGYLVVAAPQRFLCLLPLPQVQGSLRPGAGMDRRGAWHAACSWVTASRILVYHVLSFSLRTCANRNKRHPAPVSYGSVHQHPCRCESAIGDLACLSCHTEDRRPVIQYAPRGMIRLANATLGSRGLWLRPTSMTKN